MLLEAFPTVVPKYAAETAPPDGEVKAALASPQILVERGMRGEDIAAMIGVTTRVVTALDTPDASDRAATHLAQYRDGSRAARRTARCCRDM